MANTQAAITHSWKKLETISETQTRELDYKGKVRLNEAKINSLTAVLINDESFKPESYLYSSRPGHNDPQRLRKLEAKELHVTWLALNSSSVKGNITSTNCSSFIQSGP